jgi:DNA-binding transcriptional regulator YiaG
MAEVLTRTRDRLEESEREEVARHVQVMIERSGLSQREFASRIGVPNEQLTAYLDGTTSPAASLMIRIRRLSDRFAKMREERGGSTG